MRRMLYRLVCLFACGLCSLTLTACSGGPGQQGATDLSEEQVESMTMEMSGQATEGISDAMAEDEAEPDAVEGYEEGAGDYGY